MDRSIGWGIDPQAPSFSVIRPYDGKPAQVGNGTIIALQAKSAAQVDEAHRKALELGGAMREHQDPAVRTTRPTSATSTGTSCARSTARERPAGGGPGAAAARAGTR